MIICFNGLTALSRTHSRQQVSKPAHLISNNLPILTSLPALVILALSTRLFHQGALKSTSVQKQTLTSNLWAVVMNLLHSQCHQRECPGVQGAGIDWLVCLLQFTAWKSAPYRWSAALCDQRTTAGWKSPVASTRSWKIDLALGKTSAASTSEFTFSYSSRGWVTPLTGSSCEAD